MALSDRILALTLAIANAINTRAPKVGASTYDLYVISGGTLSQATWLALQQGQATTAVRNALTGVDLWQGRELVDPATAIKWRYVAAIGATGSDAAKPAQWRQWESDWMTASVGVQGFAGGYSAANGWVSNGTQYRYRGGKVGYRGNVIVNGGGAVNGQIAIGLPVAASTPFGNGYWTPMDLLRPPSGTVLALLGNPSGSFVYLAYQTTQGGVGATSANAPVTWTQQDTIHWNFEYDPA